MPGRLFLTSSLRETAEFLGTPIPQEVTHEPRYNMAPGEEILVSTGPELRPMRWGIIPVGRKNARGRPVLETIVNARSETVFQKSAFEGVRRGLVPANGWYEWTGERRKKTPWRIIPKDGDFLAFAAIWDVWTAPGGREVAQVATVTCEPSGDVKDIHHRMGVLLRPDQFDLWLTAPEEDLPAVMRPFPDGSLRVEGALDVDWNSP